MRVVLDTNILVSALMIQTGNPAVIYRMWQVGRGRFTTRPPFARSHRRFSVVFVRSAAAQARIPDRVSFTRRVAW
jgi:hypothetical protein